MSGYWMSSGDIVTVAAVAPGVALITLDRPPVNALDAGAYDAAAEAIERAAGDPSIRAAVITGAGTRAFSAGTDLAAFEDAERYARTARAALNFFETLGKPDLPLVGAINGPAVGGGAMIAAECDVLVAVERSYFSIPELTQGFVGAASHIKRLAPYFKVARMMLLGEHLTVAEAVALGTVKQAVGAAALLDTAIEVAVELARLDPAAMREARAIFRGPEERLALEGYRAELTTMLAMTGGGETKETLQAR